MAATESDVESVERVIPAPPEKIFDLLADPAKHPLIDGSGREYPIAWARSANQTFRPLATRAGSRNGGVRS